MSTHTLPVLIIVSIWKFHKIVFSRRAHRKTTCGQSKIAKTVKDVHLSEENSAERYFFFDYYEYSSQLWIQRWSNDNNELTKKNCTWIKDIFLTSTSILHTYIIHIIELNEKKTKKIHWNWLHNIFETGKKTFLSKLNNQTPMVYLKSQKLQLRNRFVNARQISIEWKYQIHFVSNTVIINQNPNVHCTIPKI